MEISLIDWKEALQEIYDWHYFWPTAIAIIILLLIWRSIRRRRRVIKLSTHEEGKVFVMHTALIDLIENTCNDVAPNSKPQVRLYEKNGKLNLKIKIRVFSDQHIERTTSIIQKQVSHTLQDTLGLENIGIINILIAGFRKSNTKKGSESTLDYPEVQNEL